MTLLMNWHIRDRVLTVEKPLVMGIVNVTPDSFYDGGKYAGADSAVTHGLRLIQEGADILDIGGESSRPGSAPVSESKEMDRVIPVIRALAKETTVPLSCDTCKSAVAEAALAAGSHIINDISAGRSDEKILEAVKTYRAGYIIMHMQGTPRDMQEAPSYRDAVAEISAFIAERLAFCEKRGIAPEYIAVDPGIGFGKRVEDNLAILKNMAAFTTLGRPLLIGASRKFFIGKILGGLLAEERLEGSIAAAVAAYLRGARIFRVHDVKETKRALNVAVAIQGDA